MICEPASGAKQGLTLPDTKAQQPPETTALSLPPGRMIMAGQAD